MAEGSVYKTTTLIGTSTTGFDDAVTRAVTRAQKTLRGVQWFEVMEQRGRIRDGGIEYQVKVDVSFTLENPK